MVFSFGEKPLIMNLLEFNEAFPDEVTCKRRFKEYRDKAGVTCRKCGSKEHYWKRDKELYECKRCGFRTTLRSGTVMQGSNLPFRYWFLAMHLITSTKKSFSAKEVQRQLGHKRYEPIWYMLHKLRSVMGLRDQAYKLAEEVEVDEGFFTSVDKDRKEEKKDGGKKKRGRGSQGNSKVLVMCETREAKEGRKKENRPDKKVRFLKIKVIEDLSSSTVNRKVADGVEPGSTVTSDAYTSYKKLHEVVEDHRPVRTPPKKAHKVLPWVHLAISNAKRLLLDVYHRIDDDFLQNYLNEFAYKFNRRYMEDPFERLLIASASHRWNEL